MASITLKNVTKVYDGGVVAVDDFNMEIADTEFIVLVGPSGCGKSTTLRMIAGLESVTRGDLYIGDRLVNDVSPKDRDIAMVFQNYALYPHMTVYENMAFGLKNRKTPKKVIDRKVRNAAKILDIETLLDRKPKALSGGQRQRVALGRAIVRDPAVFLLDEPLSNLDAKLRASMRMEIIKLHRELATTFVYVTHDQTEAMTMGDRIVVMRDGVIQQADTPQNLYDNPCNVFVAGFIGSPPMNFMDSVLERDEGGLFVTVGGHRLPIDFRPALEAQVGRPVILGLRPDHILVEEDGELPARVDVCELLGSESNLFLDFCGVSLTARVQRAVALPPDAPVRITLRRDRLYLFDKETETVL